ncbi:uncharacterized protein LOC126888559 [Diabrotica virgifera virgifera]|uniref:DUF4780 domain-containing protein n=1 Tax=Diabrotica virgifera virgifera TaxID=50390 RepID=A0ABM5KRP9_DIAVI|nr:uncharacterized protein LOC126888559 [Diabrotica virgifera virgifera]
MDKKELKGKKIQREYTAKSKKKKEGKHSPSTSREAPREAGKSRTGPSDSIVGIHHKGKSEVGKDLQRPSTSRQPPLPNLGEPGGRDDPLRRGLSGAGCRWYLRYLSQGISPETARKKALEHKSQEPASQKRKRTETVISPAQKEVKRKKEEVGEQTTTSVGMSSCAAALKSEKIAILPKGFPENTLSAEQQTLVEEAIVQEMFAEWEHKLQFGGIHFKPGYLVVDCETPQSAEWLRLKVPQIRKWEGGELTTCKGDDIPRSHVVTVFLPRSKGLSAEKLLQLIEVQNEGLAIGRWKVLSAKEEAAGQLLRAAIDELSCAALRKNGCTIFYRFGKIPVHGIKRETEKETPGSSGGLVTTEVEEAPPVPSASRGTDVPGDAENVGDHHSTDLYRDSEDMETAEATNVEEDKDKTLVGGEEGEKETSPQITK